MGIQGHRGSKSFNVATVIERKAGLTARVLSNDKAVGIRKKKTIGTRKHNSEATKSTEHSEYSDGPSDEHPTKNTQGTSHSMDDIGDEISNQPDGMAEHHDDVAQKVEPRSYRNVLMNE